MFSLARANRDLLNAAALRASTWTGAFRTAPWALFRSNNLTPDYLAKRHSDTSRENSQRTHEASTTPVSGNAIRRVYAQPGKKESFRKYPRLPRRSNAPESKPPAAPWTKTVEATGRSAKTFVSVRRESVRPLPTAVVLAGLTDDTTIGDVLLSIREAYVAGKLSADEARVLDARMHKRRANHSSGSATVDFSSPSGAKRVHTLSQAGFFAVRGLVPRTSLSRTRLAPRRPTLDGEKARTLPGSFMSADPAGKRRYLNHLKVKDKLVRRTHLNYNREPSRAIEDEEQLKLNAEFKSILRNWKHDSAGNSEHELGSKTDEARKG